MLTWIPCLELSFSCTQQLWLYGFTHWSLTTRTSLPPSEKLCLGAKRGYGDTVAAAAVNILRALAHLLHSVTICCLQVHGSCKVILLWVSYSALNTTVLICSNLNEIQAGLNIHPALCCLTLGFHFGAILRLPKTKYN